MRPYGCVSLRGSVAKGYCVRAAWVTIGLLLTWCAPALAAPGERRIALLVGHPFGGDELQPLRYTGNDVERVSEVLGLLGDFAQDDIHVSFGETADELLARFADVRDAAAGYPAERLLFLFYYSGHAKDGELRLGDTVLSLVELRRQMEQVPAALRIGLLDACRSGGITRLKGATRGEPISLSVDAPSQQRGSVFITASSADEDAQESDAIQGSFFTHFLTSGLRGAADSNADARVTLAEAYAFTYDNTVARTIGTRGGAQHPTYRFDLHGSGDVRVTSLAAEPSALTFAEELDGHYVIFDMQRRVVVAELDKAIGRAVRLAVAPGDYVVKKRERDHLRLGRIQLGAREAVAVEPAGFERVAFADDYAKGATVTLQDAREGKLGMRIAAGVLGQGFLAAPFREDVVTGLGLVHLGLELTNLLGAARHLRLDFALAPARESTLKFDDARVLDRARVRTRVSELTAGASLALDYPLWRDLAATGVVRLGWIRVARTFPQGELGDQTFATLTPGLGVELGYRLSAWLSAGVGARLHYMFFEGDESVSMAYVDGGVVLTATLR